MTSTSNSYGPQCRWKWGSSRLAYVDTHPAWSTSGHARDLIVFRDDDGELVPMLRHVADRVVTPLEGMIPSQSGSPEEEHGHV